MTNRHEPGGIKMARKSQGTVGAPRLFGRARPRAALAFVTPLVLALALAACGSSSHTSTGSASDTGNGSTGSGNGGVTVAYSQCMRTHGVPNFPDPNSQGVIEGKSSSGSGSSQINPNSPQYIAASKDCQKLASSGTTAASQSKQLVQALKYTKCMRAHGVPDFPDPTVSDGQIEFSGAQGVGRTPGFQTAQSKCASLLTGGGGS